MSSNAESSSPRDVGPSREKITAGVPLAKLIKRDFVDAADIAMLSRSRGVAAEKFRRLKTVLVNDSNAHVIAVTSPVPAEGKSVVSANLALAFAADPGNRVLVIDADLRRPSLERWIEPPPQLGLTELLRERTEIDHAILEMRNCRLHALPAGQPARDPVELLGSPVMRDLFGELRNRYDRIIVDTPPVVPFTDADVIGVFADGVVMVARAGNTRRGLFDQAVRSITSTEVIGAVLNDVTTSLADRGSGSNYDRSYYAYYEQDRK